MPFFLISCSAKSQNDKVAKIDSLTTLATNSDSLMDFKSSIKYYSEILSIDSTKLIALNNRARAYIWIGQIEKGISDVDKAVQIYPHEETFFRRGVMYLKLGNYNKSEKDLMKSITLNPKFSDSYYWLSYIKTQQDSLDLALQLCNKADKISYQASLSLETRSIFYHKKGDFKNEIKELTSLIKLEPNNPNHYNNRGLAKNNLKQYKDAITDFDYTIKLDSRYAFAYNNKAFSLLKLNKLDALLLVNKSLELDSKNAYALKNRSEIHLALNDKNKACLDLIEANKISHDINLLAEIKKMAEEACKK